MGFTCDEQNNEDQVRCGVWWGRIRRWLGWGDRWGGYIYIYIRSSWPVGATRNGVAKTTLPTFISSVTWATFAVSGMTLSRSRVRGRVLPHAVLGCRRCGEAGKVRECDGKWGRGIPRFHLMTCLTVSTPGHPPPSSPVQGVTPSAFILELAVKSYAFLPLSEQLESWRSKP